MATDDALKTYVKYISEESWLPRVEERIIDNSGGTGVADPDLYVDLSNNKIVNLSELIDLTDEEYANLNKLSDKEEKCDPICTSIKQKLSTADIGIYVGGRVISRPPTAIIQLRSAMMKRQSIDRFDPTLREPKTIPISTSVLAPSKEKKEAININEIFSRYTERVKELIGTSESTNQPVCIGLLNGTTTCAGARGIKEVKLPSLPNVTFTYLSGKEYDEKAMRELSEKYVKAYKDDTTIVKRPTSKPSSKVPTSSKVGGTSKVSSKPSVTIAQRTVGGTPAPLRTTQPKLATPGVASAPARKAVGSTSRTIQEVTLFMKKKREQESQVSASQSLAASLQSSKTAPDVAPSTKQVPSKPKTTISMPVTLTKTADKGKQHAKVEEEIAAEEEEEEAGVLAEEEEEEAAVSEASEEQED